MNKQYFRQVLLAGLLLILFGCGGSSQQAPDTSGSPSTPAEQEPSEPTPVTEQTLPRIDFFDLQGEIQNEPKIIASMKITDYQIGELPIVDYDGQIGVEYRGSSSQYYYDKKSYGIELRDSDNNDLNASILGLPEEEDWVLNGPYGDKTLIRNALMFDMAQAFGRYSSRYKFVELYINQQYNGVYVLLEKIKRDAARVDINKLKDDENDGEDVTGGYILKLDKTDGEHADNPSAYDLYTDDMSFISQIGSGGK
ncbi:CotH kinase family protein [Neptunicella sp.]|uniref:CotH kinase family protein n=1 Tax=Neptunicella sp. TaxID=2125986 RepID=UPI003F68FDF3